MPKIFLIKKRLHEQQRGLQEGQELAKDALCPGSPLDDAPLPLLSEDRHAETPDDRSRCGGASKYITPSEAAAEIEYLQKATIPYGRGALCSASVVSNFLSETFLTAAQTKKPAPD
ncbi:hypothetical protein EVAR_88716_1 [Eumeta japonica]|uniref:Uncharacterized protein n=1 Tax=Eumeta variegata TaxID=151549 RepID=A0A4C1XF38_EUMVA|nr:hypothetical protein EVAR_88716_1 [Eumeta japonica]